MQKTKSDPYGWVYSTRLDGELAEDFEWYCRRNDLRVSDALQLAIETLLEKDRENLYTTDTNAEVRY